jgi:hypothetical protein
VVIAIAILLQSISGVSAINPLVAFYDIHGGKREALFFYFVPGTTRDVMHIIYIKTFLLNHSTYLRKPHQNPLRNFEDLSIHRGRQRDFVLLCYNYNAVIRTKMYLLGTLLLVTVLRVAYTIC